jgi:hypothetical protein
MYRDVFGREIYVGSVVLISRAGQGAKDFEKGIVTKISDSGKKSWLYFHESYFYRGYNRAKGAYDDKPTHHERENCRLVITPGVNKFVSVVPNAIDLEDEGLIILSKSMISSGILPSNYRIGEPPSDEKDNEPSTVIDLDDIGSPSIDIDLLSSLGAPKNIGGSIV